jgi:putative cell wall-binding protein
VLSAVAAVVLTAVASTTGIPDPEVVGHVPVTAVVERVAGVDRYATAAALAARDDDAVVVIATGEAFPDAIAAAGAGHPVLLVRHDAVPEPTVRELRRRHPMQIVVVGGTAAVSSPVAVDLMHYGAVIRVAGRDRYRTSAAVAEWAFPDASAAALVADGRTFGGALVTAAAAVDRGLPFVLVDHAVAPAALPVTSDEVVLASEQSFADALTAATLGEPLVLVPPTCVPDETRARIEALAPVHLVLVGGPAAIDDAVGEMRSCTLPDDVTFEFGPEVTTAQRAYVRGAVDATRRRFGDPGPLLVQAYADLDELVAANVRAEGGTVDHWTGLWSNAAGRGGSGWIGIHLGADGGWADTAGFMSVIAHEVGHTLQLPIDHPAVDVPEWLLEGGAEWIAQETWTAEGWGWDGAVDWRLDRAREIAHPLSDYEVEDDVDGGEYTLGYAACEHLEQVAGATAMLDIFELVLDGTPWRAAFEQRVGMAVDDFYDSFGRWLTA